MCVHIYHAFGYERVYLSLCKWSDTPFLIQGNVYTSDKDQDRCMQISLNMRLTHRSRYAEMTLSYHKNKATDYVLAITICPH